MLHIKIKPLFVLLMARGSQAAPLGITLPKYTMRMPATTTPPAIMDEWIKHVSHVPSLVPAEILILLCLVFAFIFRVTVMLYRARKKETARTRLVLEVGNGTDSILLNAMDLPYLAKHYRIKFTRDELAFHLVESKFGAKLSWTSGLCLTNTALNMSVPLPPRLSAILESGQITVTAANSTFCHTSNSDRYAELFHGCPCVAQHANTTDSDYLPGADSVSTARHFICLIYLLLQPLISSLSLFS